MSTQLAFLGGFIVGGVTVFVVTAVFIWKPITDEWRAKWMDERARRIAAEDSPIHTLHNVKVEWGQGIPWEEAAREVDDRGYSTENTANLIDLTDIDLPPKEA